MHVILDPQEEPMGPRHVSLSGMERKVTRLVTLGCTGPEVAAILDRSLHTVINHKNRAMAKLGVHNAAALTRHALALGVTTLADALTAEELAILHAHRSSQGSQDEPAA